MDATFKIIPTFFKQLYTIHGHKQNTIIPLIYALLTLKYQRMYELLLQKIIHLADESNISLNPHFIFTDFETAAINAIKLIFPHSKTKRCFFHLCQNVYRKIQKNGLTNKYGNDETFSMLLRQIPCLAYLKPEEILNTFYI